jgi:hypothetical protein
MFVLWQWVGCMFICHTFMHCIIVHVCGHKISYNLWKHDIQIHVVALVHALLHMFMLLHWFMLTFHMFMLLHWFILLLHMFKSLHWFMLLLHMFMLLHWFMLIFNSWQVHLFASEVPSTIFFYLSCCNVLKTVTPYYYIIIQSPHWF